MQAFLRHLVASLGLFGAATLVADVTAVWTGAADDQFTNPANWQQVYVPAASAGAPQVTTVTAPPLHLEEAFGPAEAVTRIGGNVTFNEPVIVGNDVILAPGNSPGTQIYTTGLTLASGGQLDFEVDTAAGPAGTGYDLVRVTGGPLDITATSAAPFTLKVISLNVAGTVGNISDFSASNSYSWMLFEGNTAGGINGFASDKFVLDLTSFTNPRGTGVFSIEQGTNAGNPAIFLNFTAVPEPSTYALLALGLGAAAVARLRRRRC